MITKLDAGIIHSSPTSGVVQFKYKLEDCASTFKISLQFTREPNNMCSFNISEEMLGDLINLLNSNVDCCAHVGELENNIS